MKSGFTLVELLVTMAVGLIALGIIILAMNQFTIIGPKALTKVNQASKAMLIDEKLQSQLMKMGPNVEDVKTDESKEWSPYISYIIEVGSDPKNTISYRATITTAGSDVIMLVKNENVSNSPVQRLTMAKGIKSLDFKFSKGTAKYRLVLCKDDVTSTFVSAVTTMNLR